MSKGVRFRRDVSPNEDTCVVQGITAWGRVELTKLWSWAIFWYMDSPHFLDFTPYITLNQAGRGLVGVGRFSSIGQKIFINEFYSSSISWGFWLGAVFETTRATRRVGWAWVLLAIIIDTSNRWGGHHRTWADSAYNPIIEKKKKRNLERKRETRPMKSSSWPRSKRVRWTLLGATDWLRYYCTTALTNW